jgi:hypothetical protein
MKALRGGLLGLVCLALTAPGLVLASPEDGAGTTAAIMRQVYDAIAYLLPLSLRGADAVSRWDDELIETKLTVLSDAAAALESHTRVSADEETALLARSFNELVQDTVISFRADWPEFAYLSLMELTEHCATCHSRLPSKSYALFGQKLLARLDIQGLEPRAVAQLLIVTRQFDGALSILEKKLMEPGLHPVEAEYQELLLAYARIAVSTSNDYTRFKAFLQHYRQRPDMPFYLSRRIDIWLESIASIEQQQDEAPNLATARSLFDHATAMTDAPGNKVRCVYDFVAAKTLRKALQEPQGLPKAEVAEAYYLLGLITLRSSEPNPSVPAMELLMAAAIKADPKGPVAVDAYALLEEYGFVSGAHLALSQENTSLVDMAYLRSLLEK